MQRYRAMARSVVHASLGKAHICACSCRIDACSLLGNCSKLHRSNCRRRCAGARGRAERAVVRARARVCAPSRPLHPHWLAASRAAAHLLSLVWLPCPILRTTPLRSKGQAICVWDAACRVAGLLRSLLARNIVLMVLAVGAL